MNNTIIIRGGTVYAEGKLKKADVLIDCGIIQSIGEKIEVMTSLETVKVLLDVLEEITLKVSTIDEEEHE